MVWSFPNHFPGGELALFNKSILFFWLILFIPCGAIAGEMTFFSVFHVDKDQTYDCTFGLRDDAIPGFDGLDQPAPPAAPDEDLEGYLVMIDPPTYMPNRWYKDFRPVSNLTMDRVEYFPTHFISSHLGEMGSISIATGSFNSLPYEIWVQGPDGLHEQVDVPGTVNFTITSTHMVFLWELYLEDQVAVTEETWSKIKSLYR